MTSPFFSIIIPVYNIEHYIERCLVSCIKQSFKNIEIIVIDDCSDDQSVTIAHHYAQIDARINVIQNKSNLGTFQTRLIGIKEARGEYCLFIDADDFVTLDACEKIHTKIYQDFKTTKSKCDMCCFGMNFFPKNFKKTKPLAPLQILDSQGIVKTFFLKPNTPSWTIWNKAYKTDILQQSLRFIRSKLPHLGHLIMAEDALMFFIIVLFAQKSIGIQDRLYQYYSSTTSITRKNTSSTSRKKINDIQTIINALQIIDTSKLDQHFQLFKAKIKLQNYLRGTLELETRYHNSRYAYINACINSLKHYQYWKTYIRLILYCISLGKIKL